jgi:hypothetical protein
MQFETKNGKEQIFAKQPADDGFGQKKILLGN